MRVTVGIKEKVVKKVTAPQNPERQSSPSVPELTLSADEVREKYFAADTRADHPSPELLSAHARELALPTAISDEIVGHLSVDDCARCKAAIKWAKTHASHINSLPPIVEP